MLQSNFRGTNAAEGRYSAVILVSVLVSVYLISQFLRNSITVIAPDLAREFDLDATSLSLLASIFYLSFALVQIPVGMAIDRIGPRATILATSAIMIAGTFWFALARGYGDLVAARLAIGLGCSSFLMAPLAVYADRFPPGRFATMAGTHVGAGSFGTLLATAPLAFASATIGWRHSFLGVALFACLATTLVYLLVPGNTAARDRAAGPGRNEKLRQLFSGLGEVARTKYFWTLFSVAAMTYPSFAAILGLWAGPWLAHMYGMPLEGRGAYLLAMVAAQIAGLFAWASTDRLFRSYKIPVSVGALLGAILLSIPAVASLPQAWLMPYLVVTGFIFGFSPVLTAHGKTLFPPALIGRGMSLLNIGAIGGVFLQQTLTGLVMAQFDVAIVDGARVYPEAAYRWVFGLLAAEVATAGLIYQRVRDSHPDKLT